MRLLLLSALMLTACGRDDIDAFTPLEPKQPESIEYFHDPELEPYVLDYLAFSDEQGLTYGYASFLRRVEYVDKMEDDHIGLCEYYTNGERTIKILRREYGELQMRALMYHELAHCVHNSDHTEKVNPHIMNPNLPWEQQLEADWGGMLYALADFIKAGGKDK